MRFAWRARSASLTTPAATDRNTRASTPAYRGRGLRVLGMSPPHSADGPSAEVTTELRLGRKAGGGPHELPASCEGVVAAAEPEGLLPEVDRRGWPQQGVLSGLRIDV